MACNDRCAFTFTWVIENCPTMSLPSSINSSVFHADCILNTNWYLNIYSDSDESLLYSLHRACNNQLRPVTITFEISLLATDGSLFVLVQKEEEFYLGSFFEYILLEDVFRSERAKFIDNDTLIIQCRLWNGYDRSLNYSYNHWFAQTRLRIERRTFFWIVKNFSNMQIEGPKVRYCLPHAYRKGRDVLSLQLHLMEINGTEYVILTLLNRNTSCNRSIDISVLDIKGKKHYLKKFAALKDNAPKLLNCIEKKNLMENSELLLPNDALCILCKVEIEKGHPEDLSQEYTRQLYIA